MKHWIFLCCVSNDISVDMTLYTTLAERNSQTYSKNTIIPFLPNSSSPSPNYYCEEEKGKIVRTESSRQIIKLGIYGY